MQLTCAQVLRCHAHGSMSGFELGQIAGQGVVLRALDSTKVSPPTSSVAIPGCAGFLEYLQRTSRFH